MTVDKARELLAVQANMGGYNRNGAKLILAEIQKEYGQAVVDQLIRKFDLAEKFGFQRGEAIHT